MWEQEQDQVQKRLSQIDHKLNKYETKRQNSKENHISIFNMQKDSGSTDLMNMTSASQFIITPLRKYNPISEEEKESSIQSFMPTPLDVRQHLTIKQRLENHILVKNFLNESPNYKQFAKELSTSKIKEPKKEAKLLKLASKQKTLNHSCINRSRNSRATLSDFNTQLSVNMTQKSKGQSKVTLALEKVRHRKGYTRNNGQELATGMK